MEFIFVVYNIILLYIIFKSYKLSHHLFFILGKSSGLNSFGLMWCNGITFIAPNFISNYAFQTYILPHLISGLVCGPAVLFLTYIQGDLRRAIEFPYLYSPGFQVCLS
jgi:solute carrier family 35